MRAALAVLMVTGLAAGAAEPPGGVPGLVLWLDAGDPAAMTREGDRVVAWRDRSGGGHDLTAPAARAPRLTGEPLGGRPTLRFEGAQALTGPAVLPAAQPGYTVVALWRTRAVGGVQSVFEQAASPLRGNSRAALLLVGDRFGFNGESNDRHDLAPIEPSSWRLTSLVIDNTRAQNVRLSDNGVRYTGATDRPKELSLGADGVAVGRKLAIDGEYLNGDLAAVLVYDHALNRVEEHAVLMALEAAWGLDVTGGFRSPDGRPLAPFDFDGETYDDWRVEGTAFGTAPAHGTLPGQMDVTGYLGPGLANSYLGADGATGTLTSPPFRLERKYVRFLIGGGKYPGDACLNLRVGDRVVRTATGPNDKPGGTERLDWAEWDVADLVGQVATLQVLDRTTAGWGHINVDQILQTNQRLPVYADQARELVADHRYLNLPVKEGAPKRRLRVLVDGKVERDFVIRLAEGPPDYWVFLDLGPFRGKTLRLEGERLPEGSQALAAVTVDDTIRGGESMYQEPLRPLVHFTTRRGWNNDPNGLVYHAGEWHLFYQHNPYGTQWDNMHWGHAVSADLVHWQELPEAVYPDALGPCFSGSAVVDEGNTAGLAAGAEKPLICVYTAAGSPTVQCLAYSLDRGRTFAKFAGNPVLPHLIGGNRDPKVFWYAPGRKWVMALFLDGHEYGLFSSPDLAHWERTGGFTIPGTSECPELFELAVEGRPRETRWIAYGGNGGYLVGKFDGRTFTPESGPHRLHQGNCFYASQTYNGVPDGRRVLIGWGQAAMPGMPFNQMMTFPVELTLRPTPDGPRLHVVPTREVERLHGEAATLAAKALPADRPLPVPGVSGEALHVRAELELGDAAEAGLLVRGLPVLYDAKAGRLRAGNVSAPLKVEGGRLSLEVIVDRTSLEVYADSGRLYLPVAAQPAPAERTIQVVARGGAARVAGLRAWRLKSSWSR